LRVDYVLPSRDLGVKAAGVWRTLPAGAGAFPSDHYPVWMDLEVPPPPADAH
jgi:endonuclease/exonuclease/phosphatase family metal-dependent hydrolase